MAHQQHSKRSYEERTSSYKRTFGDGPSRFTYTPKSPAKKVSSSKTFRLSSSSSAGGAGPSRLSGERVRVVRSTPVSSGVSMRDITMMADSLGPDFQGMRVNEKEELQHLNTRFAGYITKVRALEQANRVLEAQVEQLSASAPSRLADMYEEELNRLRREIDALTNQKDNIQLQLDNVAAEAEKWKQKFDEEAAAKREMEDDLNDMRKDCDDATLVRLDLERRLETLQEEIEFLKRTNEQEIAELQEQIRNTEIKIESAPGPDLEELLNDMRTQYEKMAAKNRADAEMWYTEKVDNLQQQAVRNEDALRNVRSEVSEYRKSVQTLNMEIDSLRGTNDSLQRTLGEMEDRYNRDTGDLQDTINNLQVECDDLKGQMAQHLRQYQELMDVKMALDIEIATYRKLLEGEESRVDAFGEERISDRVSQMHASTVKSGYTPVRKSYMKDDRLTRQDVDDVETVTTKKVVVKTIETKDGKVVSQTEDVREQSSDDRAHPTL